MSPTVTDCEPTHEYLTPYQVACERQQGAEAALPTVRHNLRHALQNPHLKTDIYEHLVTDYVNTVQAAWFSYVNMGVNYETAADYLRPEMEGLSANGIAWSEAYIEAVLAIHLTDMDARQIRSQGISPMPRAVTLTLLDYIDDCRAMPGRARKARK